MKLLTKEILKETSELLEDDGRDDHKRKVTAKFFDPTGSFNDAPESVVLTPKTIFKAMQFADLNVRLKIFVKAIGRQLHPRCFFESQFNSWMNSEKIFESEEWFIAS